MQKQNRFTVLSLAVFLALLAAAVMPLSALAQDEVPPTDVPAVVEQVPPVVEDAAPVVEVALAAEEPQTVPEILEALPEGTDLVALGESGDALPLASAEAADVVSGGDPYFTASDGTVYGFTAGLSCPDIVDDCRTEVKYPIQSALDAFAGFDGVGNIYVESGTYDEFVYIDNSFANLTGLIGVDTGGGLPTINRSVTVMYMNAFTFQGFNLGTPGVYESEFYANANTGTLTIKDVTQYGAEGNGIGVVNQTGDVILENVSATGSYLGISITESTGAVTLNNVRANENQNGADIQTSGDVTVTDSQFNLNDDGEGSSVGLNINAINAGGNITLNNVTANGNHGDGATIWNSSLTKPVLIENSFFNDNSGIGLSVGNDEKDSTTIRYGTVRNSEFKNNAIGISVSSLGVGQGEYVLTNECNTFSGNGEDVFLSEGATQTKVPCKEPVVSPSGAPTLNDENKIKSVFTPLSDQVSVVTTPSTVGELPAALPDGKTFAAGENIKLMQSGEEITSAPSGAQASFEIPAGAEAPFTVLFWNGTKWVEVPSQVINGRVFFSVTTPGMYVLATGG